MSAEQNMETVQRSWDAANAHNRDAMLATYASDVVYHEGTRTVVRGDHAMGQYIDGWFSAFPDLHVTVEDMFASGEYVVSRLTVRGTHRGEMAGIPPTGKQVDVMGIRIMRIANGKIAEAWGLVDQMTMMQQLGLIPEH